MNFNFVPKARRNPEPRSGKAMIGVQTTGSFRYYFEASEAKLKEPLKAGVTYRASMWIHQDIVTCPTAIADIGMRFNLTPMHAKLKYMEGIDAVKEVMKLTPQVISPEGKVLHCRRDWIEVSGEFKAEGGERYVMIGCFRFTEEMFMHSTYYYFDDLSLIALDDTATSFNALLSGTEKVELKNVLFETGSAKLSAESSTELKAFAQLLNEHPELRIEVSGHTDNTGTEDKNLVLSKQRAESVAAFLEKSGIEPSRMVAVGFGSSQPVADNEKDEGRARNRRIEVRVLK